MKSKQNNKKAAVQFLKLVVERKIDQAYQRYIDLKGKHHNMYFPKGFPALLKAMKNNHAKFPNTKLTIMNVIGDENMVAVHSHVIHQPGEIGVIAVHIFKFIDEKIVEMWDCGMPIPKDAPNKDGAF